MARIPLQVAGRSLDTGGTVRYPGDTPVADAVQGLGRAVQGAGQHFQAVADFQKRKQEQKDDFTMRVKEQELNARLPGLEDEAVKGAPADGSGIHDTVYGEIDPATGTARKPGSFDALFDEYLESVPESKREEFRAKKEIYRAQGSTRLARSQYGAEQEYYKVEIAKTQNDITNAMLAGDPNDEQTFEQFKQQGMEIIDKSGLPALEKDVARENWEANASETLFKAKLEKDPAFAAQARGALGLGTVASTATGAGAVDVVVDKIIGVESGGNANAKNPNSSATGLGQFIDSTWLNMIRKYRPDLAEGKSAGEVLSLRFDPTISREMTARYTQENAEFLTNKGIQTTPGSLYLAHFLGPQGAANALKADPGASVASVLGADVVRANGFLAGKSIADLIAWSDKKMGGAGKVDPRFASIPSDRRLVLANQADVEVNQRQTAFDAEQKAAYTTHKDAIELGIVTGQVADENLILNDGVLNSGDKATLIRSVRTQNETVNQVKSDLSALASNQLSVDPYSSKDKTRVDNMYTAAGKRLDDAQMAALTVATVEQTGVVPQTVVNAIRKGATSANSADVVAAAQSATRIAAIDPAALARRDGGSDAQTLADDFGFYVNKLNLSPEDAAQRIMDKNSPEKKLARKALEPAAKEFIKGVEKFDLANEFDTVFGSEPSIGFSPGQALGIQAEFLAIAEDAFYASNGDPDVAENRAVEQMKRLYGVTEVTGRKVVMKHPPDKYWPQSAMGTSAWLGGGPGSPGLGYARQQLEADIRSLTPDFDTGSVELVTTPETDAMVKRGELPAYAVMYKDANGVIQTIPGKLWRPDIDKAKAFDQQQQEVLEGQARSGQVQERQKAPYMNQTPEDFLSGNDPASGARDFVPPEMITKPTVKDKLEERQDQLFENGPDLQATPGSAM